MAGPDRGTTVAQGGEDFKVSVVDAGIEAGRLDVSDCALCAHHATQHAAPTAERHDELLTWSVAITAAVVVACLGSGDQRWLGIGAFAGILLGALCATVTISGVRRRAAHMHERSVARMSADADERVAMVVRQFEWAVNDVVTLKRAIERAEASADLLVGQARERENYVRRLEQQLFEARERVVSLSGTRSPERVEFDPLSDAMAMVIPFRWAMHNDRYGTNLELECGITSRRPTRIRLVDGDGKVVITSGSPMWSEDGRPSFTMARPPVDLLTALEAGRETTYHFEALADYEWRSVRLEDSGVRTKIVTDKQGRMYRVSDESDAAQLLAPTITLNTLN
jgi:hypothetical protein